VAQEEPFGQLADIGRLSAGPAGQHQQHLVLLRFEPGRARCFAAEGQKVPDPVTKFFQGPQKAGGN
jgi:hypothetical protein